MHSRTSLTSDRTPQTQEPSPRPQPATEEIVDPVDGTRWVIDTEFITSNWTCIWGSGCAGILDEPAHHLQQGCCSVGAQMLDQDEAMAVSAFAAMIPHERFQFATEAAQHGVFRDDTSTATRLVDDACIFLNRPDFPGGPGCALHLAALDHDDSPLDWKPSICWQLPLKVDWSGTPSGETVAELRPWRRADWGPDGATMAWCCTERTTAGSPADAYVGKGPVVESLGEEIKALVGTEVYVELTRRLNRPAPPASHEEP